MNLALFFLFLKVNWRIGKLGILQSIISVQSRLLENMANSSHYLGRNSAFVGTVPVLYLYFLEGVAGLGWK